MLDHLIITVRDFEKSRAFYTVVMEFNQGAGFGVEGKPYFWISGDPGPAAPIHFAFHCRNRAAVDAFYAAAMAAGGRDNGPPGLRPDYHPSYYAAFVLDPDGNNVEAVCHVPE
jgi:catechol 2,3-dioxygenase-like lactoylglutathione lyase family enzyme